MQSGRLLVSGDDFYCGSSSGSPCQLALKNQLPATYIHPATKQCNYSVDLSQYALKSQIPASYVHPSSKQCNWSPSINIGNNIEVKTGTHPVGMSYTSGSIEFSRTPFVVLLMIRYEYTNQTHGSMTLIIEQGYNLGEELYFRSSSADDYDYVRINYLSGTTLAFSKHYNTNFRYTALAFVQ